MTGVKARLAVLAALVGVALLSISPATAEGPNAVLALAGCTTNTLAANDDSYTGVSVPIGFTANFFGNPYTQLSVNNNGNVTFDVGLYKYTPFDFTITGNVIIAPFLADVDTRGSGSSVVKYGQTTYNGSQAFCVNWVNVGYYSNGVDKLNSFQLLLVNQGGGNFDIIYNYDKIQWETGNASGGSGGLGGTSAAVGFSNGDGGAAHYYVRAGSYTNGALLDGNASTGLTHGSVGTTQLGRYIFQVRNTPSTGSTLTGKVFYPSSTSVVPQAPVEICASGGSCVSRFTNDAGVYRVTNLVAGSYTVTAHTPATSTYTDGHGGPIAVSGLVGATFTQNVNLGAFPGAPPSGTTITSFGTSGGIPNVNWNVPLIIETTACAGGTGTFQISVGGSIVRTGAMRESPSGHYKGTAAPLSPNHGEGHVHITIDCPGSVPDVNIDFTIYIDPSGRVVDGLTGQGIAGATVTLFRSDSATGSFIQIANGSAVMSPENRLNPSTTATSGRFGWDVIAGFYKVHAVWAACGEVDSAALNIPPPVTNLLLKLPCKHKAVQTKITKAKINAAKRMATFKYSGSGGVGHFTFQCKMDKKKWASCKSGKAFTKLKRGNHTLLVRAKSYAMVDKSPAKKKFKI
jgi:hypothetical protein